MQAETDSMNVSATFGSSPLTTSVSDQGVSHVNASGVTLNETTFTVRNTHTPQTDTLTVNKTWEDTFEGYSFKSYRPASITVTLQCSIDGGTTYQDVSAVPAVKSFLGDSYTLTKTISQPSGNPDTWSTTFTDLPLYVNTTYTDDNHWGSKTAVIYRVREAAITYYQEKTSARTGSDLLSESTKTAGLTNTLQTKTVTIHKEWVHPAGYGGADTSIEDTHTAVDATLELLYGNGADDHLTIRTVTVPKNGSLTVTLPAGLNSLSRSARYRLTETTQHYHYQAAYSTGGTYDEDPPEFDANVGDVYIRNTLTDVTIGAHKTWDDRNNHDEHRPASLTFTLSRKLASGNTWETLKTETANPGNHWTVNFGKYLSHDSNNQLYEYQVQEAGAGEYSVACSPVSYSYSAGQTSVDFDITNSHPVHKNTIRVEKHWEDGVYKDDRPALTDVRLQLWFTYEGASGSWPVSTENGLILPTGFTNTYTLSQLTPFTDDLETAIDESQYDSYLQFENLPLYYNPSGSGDTPGNRKTVTYFIKEYFKLNGTWTESHNAYTVSCSDDDGVLSDGRVTLTGDTGRKIVVSNTLKLRDITVQNYWDDNAYNAQYTNLPVEALRYDLSVTLSNTGSGGSYTHSQVIGKTNCTNNHTTGVVFRDVPMYDKNGNALTYTVQETINGLNIALPENANYTQGLMKEADSPVDITVLSHRYGYVASCTSEDTEGHAGVVSSYLLTHRLPLADISVATHWAGEPTVNGSTFRDFQPASVVHTLYRSDAPGADTPVFEPVFPQAPPAGTDPVGKFSRPDPNSSDGWSLKSFANLLRYSADNQAYSFKAEESAVNAYFTTYGENYITYTPPTADNDPNVLNVTNTLITRPVEIGKLWQDGGYPDSTDLHFDLYFKLTADQYSNLYFDASIPKGGSTATMLQVPVYDGNNAVVRYTMNESPVSGNFTNPAVPYGYAGTSAGEDYTSLTVNGETRDVTGQNVLKKVTFTNTLPLTTVQVEKVWVDADAVRSSQYDQYYHNNQTVSVEVTRTSDGTKDGSFSVTSNTLQQSNPVSFTKLLCFDANGNPYSYQVSETPVSGYTTEYSDAAVAVDQQTEVLTVTNSEITTKIILILIDGTYEMLYNSREGYSDILLPNGIFHFVKKNTDTPIDLYKKKNESVYSLAMPSDEEKDDYELDGNELKTVTELVTDGNGKIVIENVHLNEYTLRQIDPPPASYTIGDTRTYDFDCTDPGKADIPATAKARNYEAENSITLTKVDAENVRTPLSQATYQVLRLIPQATNPDPSLRGLTMEQYLSDACDAVINSGGDLTDHSAVWNYWDQIHSDTVGQTGDDGKIFLHPVEFGTYFFMEIQSTDGYRVDYTDPDLMVTVNHETIAAANAAAGNTGVYTFPFTLQHEEPRKTASLQVFKADEFDNPLNGGKFTLYYQPDASHSEPPDYEHADSITPRTDHDYIFFKDNNVGNASGNSGQWIHEDNGNGVGYPDANGTMNVGGYRLFARFFDAQDRQVDAGGIVRSTTPDTQYDINMWEKSASEEGNPVFKVQPPAGAVKVQFYLAWSSDLASCFTACHTQVTDFQLGMGFTKASASNNTALQNWVIATNTNTQGGFPADPSVPYTPTVRKVVVTRNFNRDWDDLHIVWYRQTDTNTYEVVGQDEPGYLMEPHGTGKNSLNQDIYELTIPEGATHFKLNNGYNPNGNTAGNHTCRYETNYTALQSNSALMNNGNYFYFANADSNDYLNLELTTWPESDIPIAFQAPVYSANSDHEYLYFTSPASWGSPEHLYAFYSGGSNISVNDVGRAVYTAWPGLKDVGSYVNENNERVYRFNIPLGATNQYQYVTFTTGSTRANERTAAVQYITNNDTVTGLGQGYWWSTQIETWGTRPDQGRVTADYVPVSSIHTPDESSHYDDRYLYLVNPYASENGWDDLHVFFSADVEGNEPVNQEKPGYLPTYIGTYTDEDAQTNPACTPAGDWYRILVPKDARYFTLNNGHGPYHQNVRTSATYELVQGSIYVFDDTDEHHQSHLYTLSPVWVPDNTGSNEDTLSAYVDAPAAEAPVSGAAEPAQMPVLFAHTDGYVTRSADTITQPVSGKVYFTNTDGWTDVYLYYWGGSDTVTWPGVKMQLQDGQTNIYQQTVPDDAVHVIFHNNDGQKTPDIDLPQGASSFAGYLYKPNTNGSSNSTNYLCWTPHTDHQSIQYVYFFTNAGVAISSSWPGQSLDNNSSVYSGSGPGNITSYMVEIPSEADKVIFSSYDSLENIGNTGFQTDDLVISTILSNGDGVYATSVRSDPSTGMRKYDIRYTTCAEHYIAGDSSDYWTSGYGDVSAPMGFRSYNAEYQQEDRYNAENNYVYITVPSDTDKWSNLHVHFADSASALVGTAINDASAVAVPGFSLTDADKVTSGSHAGTYRFLLPKNAAALRLTGVNTGTNTEYHTVYAAVHAGSTYTIGSTVSQLEADAYTITETLRSGVTASPQITVPEQSSDMDYLFFTNNTNDGLSQWIDSSHPTMYAYYFGGADGEYQAWPGVPAVTSHVDNNGQTVYVFRPPTGDFPKVIFNNGSSDDRRLTTAITYTTGYGYRKDTASAQVYGVRNHPFNALPTVSWDQAWEEAGSGQNPASTPQNTLQSGQYLFIEMNGTPVEKTTISDNRELWDDLHILFYDDSDAVIGAASPGYLPELLTKQSNGHAVYRIAVPEGTASFQLTNGQGKGNGSINNYRKSVVEPYVANSIYRFSTEGEASTSTNDSHTDGYLYHLTGKVLSDGSSPAAQGGDPVRLATVITGEDGLPQYITWLKPQPKPDDPDSYDPDDENTYLAGSGRYGIS